MFATPKRRIICWAVLAWFIVREFDVLLTLLTLHGSLANRVGHWDFFDAKFYVFLAQRGYVPGHVADSAYFPGYPLLAHVLLMPQIPAQAALFLVSNGAALAAGILVGLLVYHETLHEHAAIWAAVLLAALPLGVFLSTMYSDSLFLALVAACWLAARTEHWRLVGILLALAIITRPFGIALALALLVEFIWQHRGWRDLPWLVVPSIVTGGGFLLVVWQTFGTPLVILTSESRFFSHALTWPWQTIWLALQQFLSAPWFYPRLHILLDGLPLLVAILCVAVLLRRWPASFTVYVCLVILLCLITPIIYPHGAQDALASDGRYLYAAAPLLLIPMSCWLTHWPRWSPAVLVATSFVLQIGLTAFVLQGGWLV